MRTKALTLALQGGGSHGAFTWGVLDRLLEDERLEIEGISGASAGAINAVVLAHGFTVAGREGAREALRRFWESIASRAPFMSGDAAASPAGVPWGLATYLDLMKYFSPQQLNPLDLNPLRGLLADQVDFERLNIECRIKLFVAATQVRSGTLRLFETKELTLDAVLASACLPLLNQAIEIDGEAYWDGGFTANPPVFPLIYQCTARDIMVVLLHPSHRPEVPTQADAIRDRFIEISLGSTFHTEMQRIALAKQDAQRSLLPIGRLDRRFRELNLHLIEAQEFMSRLHTDSKLNTGRAFLTMLHEEGRRQAELWLQNRFRTIGRGSSDPAASARAPSSTQ
jgi:NTE family protein